MTFTRTLPRAATLQPQPSVLNTPFYVPRPGMHTCACVHTQATSQAGRKCRCQGSISVAPWTFPWQASRGGKQRMGREDLSSKLTQISSEGPFPFLSDLLYKTTDFYRFQDSSGNRKKDQENGKSLSSGQSRLESKVHHALLLLASPGSSSSPHKTLSSGCINIRPDVIK